MKLSSRLVCLTFGLGMALLVGCEAPKDSKAKAGASAAADDHGHNHDHGEHGPHGGHLIVLDPGHVHAEWTHDDAKLVTVYLDELSAAPSEVSFVVKVGDAEPQVFPMKKSESKEADQAAAWTLAGEALLVHVNAGEAAKVSLVVKTADGELKAAIEHSEEHDHKH